MANILVLGNGFDLYHSLKTRYSDFINAAKKPNFPTNSSTEQKIIDLAERNPIFQYLKTCDSLGDGWIDFENEIRIIVDSLSKLIHQFEHSISRTLSFSINDGRILSKRDQAILLYFKEYFYFNSTSLQQSITINDPYYGQQGIKKQKIIHNLRNNLDNLIESLGLYLDNEYKNTHIDPTSPQISSIFFDYIINFNYTKTYQKYGIGDDKVFFIHGSLGQTPNNMVLGISDADKNESNIDFVYFKKYFQRIQKRTGLIDMNRFDHNTADNTTYFFGHSLSDHDGDIIRKIYDHSGKFIVFYLDQTDYETKIVNLITVFGKDDVMTMIETGNLQFEQIQ